MKKQVRRGVWSTRLSRSFGVFSLLFGFVSAPMFGQMTSAPPDRDQQKLKELSTLERLDDLADDSIEKAESVPTAEEMLRALQRERPQNEIILSRSALQRVSDAPQRPIWPEGTAVVDRVGQLFRSGKWWWMQWADAAMGPPIRLLPNLALEQMERTSQGSARPMSFEVSGEYALFQGENYLLVVLARRVRDDSPGSDTPTPGPIGNQPLPSTASVDQVLDKVRQQESRIPPLPKQSPVEDTNQGTPFQWAPIVDGTPLISRLGRTIADGDGWTFVFESDHEEHPQPPMKLLPNHGVELMIEMNKKVDSELVFVISGEITAYRGENYLLTRSATRQLEYGNLRR